MLTALAIRDVVLIERLDLRFGPGLTVLTGETGAGKSILLDSLGLALGARADSGLVRTGADQASVTASFAPLAGHPVLTLLDEQGITQEDEIVVRRVVGRDGRSRASINDQPVGVALLRRAGQLLVEVQGQGDQAGLADPVNHLTLLDSFAASATQRATVRMAWAAFRGAIDALEKAHAAIDAAAREEDWLRHAVEELQALAPKDGEEEHLAGERQRLQQGERRAEAIATALTEIAPRDRRNAGPAASLRAASRALQRLAAPGQDHIDSASAPAMAALERAEEALAEAETLLSRLATEAESDPRLLEQAEERLFALRAAARKHGTAVSALPALQADLVGRLAALDSGTAAITELEAATSRARADYIEAAKALTAARTAAAKRLQAAVMHELPPLRLDRARFVVELTPLDETRWGVNGADQVRFLIATNPGQTPGALDRIASGGELSRLMLALKVALAGGSTVPTLVFDEVDSGVGGATAAAVGERLARVADAVQVLVVTHSPQVAARGSTHLQVLKQAAKGRAETSVVALNPMARREEIARMLAGETVTEAARAAADSLLGTVCPTLL
jgi:DNA repair protein RecN (Recombination protein N)